MDHTETHVVTGAFGFTGQHIARRLLARGVQVRTLTNRPPENRAFADQIKAFRYRFDDRSRLTESLRGAAVLFNTYWVRFSHGKATHDLAVENTKTLFQCAADAGVRRLVHISITQPDAACELQYFRGKAELEHALATSGLSYAILRPTVLFGHGDILLNNIA